VAIFHSPAVSANIHANAPDRLGTCDGDGCDRLTSEAWAIADLHNPRPVRLGADQFQDRPAGEYWLSSAKRDWVHHEHILVDEPEPSEPLCGTNAARHAEVLSGLLLVPGYRIDEVGIVVDDQQFRVVPAEIFSGFGDNDGA